MTKNSDKSKDDVPKPVFPAVESSANSNNSPNEQPADFLSDLSGVAFYILFAARFIAAKNSPIQDCDEVFNYWEPTHYLTHGYGMQTWEYSPEFALRSWLYTGIHALPIYATSLLPLLTSKTTGFLLTRVLFGYFCAKCESRFFDTISRAVNPRVAIIYLIISASSAGMFHASVAYLPSSFAMYTVILAVEAFMNRGMSPNTAEGLTWLAVGTIVGWPFVFVLCIPFLLQELESCIKSHSVSETFWRLLDGLFRSILILAFETGVDSFFYRKPLSVPLNMVLYNVFSDSSKGPDIYGTEPWHFYIRNLLINFNFWFILASTSLPLLVLQQISNGGTGTHFKLFRSIVFTTPFYLWMIIFSLQPHKEERFMYPIYPCLMFNAAIALHIIVMNLTTSPPSSLISRIPKPIRFIPLLALVVSGVFFGIIRSAGLSTAYTAPLNVYTKLSPQNTTQDITTSNTTLNVCVGKEWYRYPSSYHLPSTHRLKFIKSEFAGLLPGEFPEQNTDDDAITDHSIPFYNFYPGTYLLPKGMNDVNREDQGKYVKVEDCDFLVDSEFDREKGDTSELEPDFINDTENWKVIGCERFLDTARTGALGRLFWVPDWSFVPRRYRREWGRYCLLERRTGHDVG